MAKLIHEIDAVRCIDETGGSVQESFGGDEIALAGIQIDFNGKASPAKRFKAGDFAKSKEEKVFDPPKVFASFNLLGGPPAGPAFPRLYQVVLILAELDEGGGLDQHIDNVVEKVNKQEMQFSAAGAATVALLTKVGEVAVKEARNFIEAQLKDDIFPPIISKVEIADGSFKFENGKHVTSRESSTVVAANGKYVIKHNWRVNL